MGPSGDTGRDLEILGLPRGDLQPRLGPLTQSSSQKREREREKRDTKAKRVEISIGFLRLKAELVEKERKKEEKHFLSPL